MRRLFQLLLLLLPAFGAALAHAQGGPPFITDDPGTPGNRHWEINFGWIADHNPGNAYYETPDIDMNYGWGDRIQLKYELPMAVATDQNNTTRAGSVSYTHLDVYKRQIFPLSGGRTANSLTAGARSGTASTSTIPAQSQR